MTSGSAIMEYGDYTNSQADRAQWHTVTLTNEFNNPVVVMGPPSFNGGDPSVLLVKNV
jgi:hypothetical protein